MSLDDGVIGAEELAKNSVLDGVIDLVGRSPDSTLLRSSTILSSNLCTSLLRIIEQDGTLVVVNGETSSREQVALSIRGTNW